MQELSARELEIYNIYKDAILRNEKIPTLRELADDLGLSYTAVHTYTNRIIAKGYLIRTSMILAPGIEV